MSVWIQSNTSKLRSRGWPTVLLILCFTGSTLAATETVITPRKVQTETIKPAPPNAEPAPIVDSPITDSLDATPDTGADDATDVEPDAADNDFPVPAISTDHNALPPAVLQRRQAILDAAEAADFEQLRSVINDQSEPPILSFGGVDDPIDYLKSVAGDADGLEILAILIEVLEAGYAHVLPGTDEAHYLWPYYAAYPFEKLTPEQRVDMFKLLTAGDLQDMQEFGSYFFYRLGISESGEWVFFVAGD